MLLKNLLNKTLTLTVFFGLVGCIQFTPSDEGAVSSAGDSSPAVVTKADVFSPQAMFPAGGDTVVSDARKKVKLTVTGISSEQVIKVEAGDGAVLLHGPAGDISDGVSLSTGGLQSSLSVTLIGGVEKSMVVPIFDGEAVLDL